MKKERKINDCKSRRNFDKIISLLKQKKSYSYVAKKVDMGESSIRQIAKENGLKHKVVRENVKRNIKLRAMLSQGLSYDFVAAKFNITRQRVFQFAKQMGISRWEESRAYYKETINKINAGIAKGLTYQEIKDKYNLNEDEIKKCYSHGLKPMVSDFRKKRNDIIVSAFAKGKTAEEIIALENRLLISPQKINNINSVYRIAGDAGIKRYPQIGDRSKGQISESKEVLYLILLYRDELKYTFKKIAKLLNKKHRTITGKKFLEPNLAAKYKVAKKVQVQ